MAPHVFLWAVGVYLLIMAAGPEGYARFRGPVVPILALYAGRGWDDFTWMPWRRRQRSTRGH